MTECWRRRVNRFKKPRCTPLCTIRYVWNQTSNCDRGNAGVMLLNVRSFGFLAEVRRFGFPASLHAGLAVIAHHSSSEFRNSLGRYAGDASGMHSFPVRVALRMRTLRSLATAKVSFATNGSGARRCQRKKSQSLQDVPDPRSLEGKLWSWCLKLLLR
eukprot:s3799_g6.t1